MKRTLLLSSILCLSISAAGCAAHRVDPEAERRALLDADRAFAEATARRGLEGWVSAFADNGAMLPANAPIASGKAAIREQMAHSLTFPGFSLTWEPLRAEVSSSGDLGYTLGRFEAATLKDGQRIVLQKGKYVSIWRKQPDGAWKVEIDIGNPGEPTREGRSP